jgi:hypothetical protein
MAQHEQGGGRGRGKGGLNPRQGQLLGPPQDYFGKVIASREDQEQYWNYAQMWLEGENLRPVLLKIVGVGSEFDTEAEFLENDARGMWEKHEEGVMVLELYDVFKDSFFLSLKNVSLAKRWFWLVGRELEAGAHYEMAFDFADRRLAYHGKYSGAAAVSAFMRVILVHLEKLQESDANEFSLTDMGFERGLRAAGKVVQGYLNQYLATAAQEKEDLERKAKEERMKEAQIAESKAAAARASLGVARKAAAQQESVIQGSEEAEKQEEAGGVASVSPGNKKASTPMADKAVAPRSNIAVKGDETKQKEEVMGDAGAAGGTQKASVSAVNWEGSMLAAKAAIASAGLTKVREGTEMHKEGSSVDEDKVAVTKLKSGLDLGPAGLRTDDGKDTDKQEDNAEQVCNDCEQANTPCIRMNI